MKRFKFAMSMLLCLAAALGLLTALALPAGAVENIRYSEELPVLPPVVNNDFATVVGHSISLNGEIGVNFYLSIPETLLEDGLNAKLDGEPVAFVATSEGYRLTKQISARQMNDPVKLTLHNANGTQVRFYYNDSLSKSHSYSVQDYLQSVIGTADSDTDKLVTLCKAMSDYGSYAQIYQGYDADNAQAPYFAGQIAAVTASGYAPTVSEPTASVAYYGASVLTRSETAIHLYFKLSGDAENFSATVNGAAAALTPVDGGYGYVEIADIPAKNLGDGNTVVVTGGADTVRVENYSVYTYVEKILDAAGSTDALKMAVKALKFYGDQAAAYFGAAQSRLAPKTAYPALDDNELPILPVVPDSCKNGHTWDEGVVTAEPTCTDDGVRTYTCTVCKKQTKTEAIPALGHDHQATVTAPTCTEGGYTTHTCSRCGDSYVDGETEALGHLWGEGEVTLEPTEEADGEMTFTCSRCNETRTEVLPKLTHEHSYTETVTEPTCTEEGYTTHTCTGCNASYRDSFVPALGHEFADGVCTRCDATDPTVPSIHNPFEDVKENNYFYHAVLWAVEKGITTGTTPTTFRPDNLCTRAEIVTFLWRAYGEPMPEKNKNPFADVVEGKYYYNAVLWAVEKGITKGTSANRFGVDDTCTRAQAVTFLWRAAGKPTHTQAENKFEDVKDSDYYYNAVLWAVEKGIAKGTTETTFRPDSSCTRGQIVTFLYRSMAER